MDTKVKIISNKKELDILIDACIKTGYACLDYETNGKPIYNKDFKPTILSVTFQPGFSCCIPLDHFQTEEFTDRGWNWKSMLKRFGHRVIENPKVVKMAWNWKFDDQINQLYNIYYRGTCIDGMLAKYVLNEERPHGLKDMVRRYLPDYGDYEKSDAFDKIPWDQKELEPLCQYGGTDTDMTFRLCIFLEKKLIDLGFYSVFRNLFMCNSRVLTSVEKTGLYMDREFNSKLLSEYKPKIDKARETCLNLPRVKKFTAIYNQKRIDDYVSKIESELADLDVNNPSDKRKIASREQKIANIRAGIFTTKKEQELIRPVNLGSSIDLPELMYSEDGFGFKVIKLSDKGKPSTDEETLVELRLTIKNQNSPKAIFLDNLLELRGLEKMYKTYILGWFEKVQDDSRLHGRYLIHGTDSNRFSSQEPNMQQIPKTSVDPNIKNQLIAPPGKLYLVFDYSQAELRMMAHLSGDETYLEAFKNGDDPHLSIAAAKYHVSIEEANKAYGDEKHPDHKLWSSRRKQAKQIAFGLIYGIGDKLLAQKLSDPKAGIIVTKEEARKEMDSFFSQHPKILKFKEKQERYLRKHGYYTQLFGTRRRLPQIYSDDNNEVAYAIRLGLNFPCLLPSSQALSKTKGWVNYEELNIGDEILAFNRETGKSEWQPVTRVNVFDYDGDMVRIKSKHLDVLSTPDHRWVVTSTKRIGDLTSTKVMTSEELFESKRSLAIPIRAEHNNINSKVYDDNIIAFIGWYLTDGHLMKRGNIRITQSIKTNPDKVKVIDDILNKLDIRYSYHYSHGGDTKVWTVLDKVFVNHICNIVPDKRMSMEFVSSLPQDQLEILLYNLRLGDGWSMFASSKKDQAELVQAITVLCNNSSSMFELSHDGDISYFKNPTRYGQESVISRHTSYGVKFSNFRKSVNTRNSYNDSNNLTKVKYNGKVWCPTVPSGAFFTRVIGEDKRYRTLITGNCQGAAANMTNFGAILLYWSMRQGKLPKMQEVATVHDAVYMNTEPKYINTWTVNAIWNILRNPSTKKYFGFQVDDVDMDMDFTVGRSMAEELPFIPGYDYNKMLEPGFSVDEYMEEYKNYKSIHIKDYPKYFSKEIEAYEKDFKRNK